MERTVILDDIIPATQGKAYELKKGQVLRVYLVEDKQAADFVFFNAHDYKEWFHVGQTWVLNSYLGTGTAKSYKHLYSKAPRENLMLTVVEDTVKVNFGNSSARCSRSMLERTGRSDQKRSCQENFEQALAPYGLTGDDIGDCFAAFVNVDLDNSGAFTIKPPVAMKGDHIDLLAEMDILTAVSACPSDRITNDYRPKPLGVTVLG